MRITRRSVLASILSLFGAGAASADQILQLDNDSLTTYLAGATSAQGVQPSFLQRGVNIDGTLRLQSAQGWALAGNPFGEGWDNTAKLGSMRLDTGTISLTEVD